MFLTKKILVCVLLLLTLPTTIFASSLEEEVESFVSEVYTLYANQEFAQVYNLMHPKVQAGLDQDDYIKFQEHHFQRLRLKISELEVEEVKKNPRLPQEMQEFVTDSNETVYGVSLSYRAHFTSGIRLNQKITKTVFVVASDPSLTLYLLWDPSSLEEEPAQ